MAKFISIIENKTNIRLEEYSNKDHDNNATPIELVSRGEVDITLVANSESFDKSVTVILPVYRGVLHVFVREGLELESNQSFIENHSIYVENDFPASLNFLELLAKRRNFNFKDINLVKKFESGKTDLIIAFSAILPSVTKFKGYRILSFGLASELGKGSEVEAISHWIPQMSPFVIPANTYLDISGNEKPVVTIAGDMLLVANKNVDPVLIRKLAQSLISTRTELSTIMPSIFHGLTDKFDPLRLKYPLHPGAIDFLERKQPSFIERYAEVINMLVYLVVLLFTASVAFVRWQQRKRKNRIDGFYQRLFLIRDSLGENSTAKKSECINELKIIEREAFQLLIDEKVSADSSFLIFETLLHDTIAQTKKHFSS